MQKRRNHNAKNQILRCLCKCTHSVLNVSTSFVTACVGFCYQRVVFLSTVDCPRGQRLLKALSFCFCVYDPNAGVFRTGSSMGALSYYERWLFPHSSCVFREVRYETVFSALTVFTEEEKIYNVAYPVSSVLFGETASRLRLSMLTLVKRDLSIKSCRVHLKKFLFVIVAESEGEHRECSAAHLRQHQQCFR